MKVKPLVAFLFLFVLTNGIGQENFKLISYNIWNGFEWGKDTVRQEKLLSWMDSKKPDVVALQELCDYNDDKLTQDAKAWGHDYSVLLKTTGYSVGLTSKYPIVLKEKIIEGMHHGALHCSTNGFEIFVVHLSPSQWEKRSEEAEILSGIIDLEIKAGNKVLVCGDFNALSPADADWYNSRADLLQDARKRDEKNDQSENLREGNFDYSVMSKFYGVGLFDNASKFVGTGNDRISFPTQVFRKTETDKKKLIDRGTRIDYILTSYNLVNQCIDTKIYNGPEAYFLSDHYPVESSFILE
ncbi:endonuclease/exonuclease/phosphatase family protein [Maribacter sp. HTCC2170]|uniref:endonuclease/exonuclease/phosphatase family protein n=1 Tax=Maribacter sp. (strain HTCC2170 / KCCM 42371) TaxID=313603 RepID=UPI00006B4983|nr:endonuclease/exonuclease/phosphatase family protein [Maribacter sp. HTCC2170]EAR00980.1 hypothetical protein FB2170_09421 [Maribacter sp. HTCC2170]